MHLWSLLHITYCKRVLPAGHQGLSGTSVCSPGAQLSCQRQVQQAQTQNTGQVSHHSTHCVHRLVCLKHTHLYLMCCCLWSRIWSRWPESRTGRPTELPSRPRPRASENKCLGVFKVPALSPVCVCCLSCIDAVKSVLDFNPPGFAVLKNEM